MHRSELRIASLFVVLAACQGDEIIETSTGSSSESSATTADDATTNPTTAQTTPPDTIEPTTGSTIEPTTEPPTTSTGPTTVTTVDDTGTMTTTTGEMDTGTGTSTSTTADTDGTTGTTTDTGGTTLDMTTASTTDTDGTTSEPILCPNGVIDPGEACDGDLLGGETCSSQGFDAGTLACGADCTFDTTACVTFSCGNDTIEGNEACDGADLANQTCMSQGFDGGNLACAANCGAFDTSNCFKCGNDQIDGPDVCDGADLGGQDCVSQGFDGGSLACAPDCSAFDSAGCFECGDNTINGAETCDGPALGGETCTSQGFFTGTLVCQADCAAFDTAMCTNCGNNTVDMSETCDGNDLDGATCTSQGFFKGTLSCQNNCNAYDTAGCSNCGNGTLDPPEACEGNNLNGATCGAQGLEYGYLCCGLACGLDLGACYDELLESEPNDDGATATSTNDFSAANADGPITSNTTVVGAIMPAGDDDIYAVTNTANVPAILTAETFGPNGPGTCPHNDFNNDHVLEVRSMLNGLLASSFDEGIGYCSRITNFEVAPNTTVYLRMIDSGDNGAIAKYYMNVDLRPIACGDAVLAPAEQCDDGNLVSNDGCSATCTLDGLTSEIEPNATNAEADATNLVSTGNSRYTGAISANTDVDRYRLDLAQPGFVRLETFSKGNDCLGTTTTMRVFNPMNVSLITDSTTGIQSCSALVFPLPAGSSYVQVEETGLNATIPLYQLDMKLLADNGLEAEPNDLLAQANTNIQIGSDVMVRGDHPAAADLDFYAINVPECGSSLRVELIEGDRAIETCESNGVDSFLTLFDSTGKQLDADDDTGRGFCSLIDGTGTAPAHAGAHKLAAGTYYVQVKSSPLASMGGAAFIYRLAATIRKP